MANIKSFPNNQDEFIGAEEVMRWLHGRTSGVFGANANAAVAAVPGAMAVDVSDGTGWLSNAQGDGIVWWNDKEKTSGEKLRLNLAMADGVLDRIDRIVVSWETTNYVALPTISVLKGEESSTPVAPALTNNSTLRQISLARILIPAGTLSLTGSSITDERLDPQLCGIVTDSVAIDTSLMQTQFGALLESLQDELSSVEAGTGVELRKLVFTNVTVSAFSITNTYDGFPYRASVALNGVIASMVPEVVLGVEDAVSGNFAPVAETYNGGIYLYAAEIPASSITIPTVICWRG